MTGIQSQIELKDRAGRVVGVSLVDADDAAQPQIARRRWSIVGGYVGTEEAGKNVYLHRVILGLGPWAYGAPEVDHINRNRFDNRKDNLRVVTRAQNCQNLTAKGESRFRGVHYDASRGAWRAQVNVDGKRVLRARFRTELEAAIAAEEARLRVFSHAVPDPVLREALESRQG